MRWARAIHPRTGVLQGAAIALAGVALLVVLALRFVGASQAVATATHNGAVQAGALVGRPAPDFTITVWNGTPDQRVHLAALRGGPVVVNFWAPWCEPCQQEAPLLQAAWQRYHPRGVTFIGVAFDSQQSDSTQFLRRYGITYPCGPDPTEATAPAYGLVGLPATIIIDKHGIVTRKVSGPVDARALDQALQPLLAP
jgi:cytochrome c biogenesis protein CcmG, thiol:disulfide interchange protein DsbE